MGNLYLVLDFRSFVMVAIVSVILFLDCQMMGFTLIEYVKNGNLEFLVLVNNRTWKR